MNIPKLSFSFRLILAYFLIIGSVAWFIVNKSIDVLDTSVKQAAEEVMIDTANLLAQQIQIDLKKGQINTNKIEGLIKGYLDRTLNAQIYSVLKTKPSLQIYVTDHQGQLLFDSGGKVVGADFSQWRDVLLTLQGQYGARSTDTASTLTSGNRSTMFIAAPIHFQGKIIGVVSVSKHESRFDGFTAYANKQLRDYALLLLIASLVFGGFITWWLARSVRKLVYYADQLGTGERANPPRLREKELQRLSHAMASMQSELQDKQYIENYLHTLAHELKSPLTGIEGAVELLREDIPNDDKQRFIDNIGDSAERMLSLIERLLELARLEKQQNLDHTNTFKPFEIANNIITDRYLVANSRGLTIHNLISKGLFANGDDILIEQALANLLDNAIDFSTVGGAISMSATLENKQFSLCIQDQGTGIADNMHDKVFDRFVSTPRPSNKKRSTGLGLNFVREVMTLHGGVVELKNTNPGLKACLKWKLSEN